MEAGKGRAVAKRGRRRDFSCPGFFRRPNADDPNAESDNEVEVDLTLPNNVYLKEPIMSAEVQKTDNFTDLDVMDAQVIRDLAAAKVANIVDMASKPHKRDLPK